MQDPRRATPRTDRLLADRRLQDATARLGPMIVKRAVNDAQARCRAGEISPEQVVEEAVGSLPVATTSMRRVINATGVVVHTNLGRAVLGESAVEAIRVAAGATDVELDLATGERGTRGQGALAALARAVPGAGDVHVVNNGAAALALAGCALATGRSIVVARGELVEIGDSFRIPELLEAVGAELREVGATNRVRLDDYAHAVDDTTAFVLKVHPSNFVIEGFTSAVPVELLASLPVPLVADIGSGLLARHPRLPDEPNAADTLRAGAALVTASGDKLLGGPQCGLILGRADLVQTMRRHPLARALRVDKLTLAALEATLTGPATPVVEALARRRTDLVARARAIVAELGDAVEGRAFDTVAAVGGGGAPGVELESGGLSLPPELAAGLRAGDPAVMGRVERGRLVLDLIAVDPRQDAAIVEAVRWVAKQARS
ncbi:MAG: L-seryl-tRNA(Sec) selenium transferase [Nocardioidaceae bacterium]